MIYNRQCAQKTFTFHFYFLSPKNKEKKIKATNYGKSLVASSLTCPLKIPCQRNGHQSLHSGFNIDCLGEKVLRLRLVVVVESTPQLEQAAWRGEVGESGRGGRRGRARVVTRTTKAGFLNGRPTCVGSCSAIATTMHCRPSSGGCHRTG